MPSNTSTSCLLPGKFARNDVQFISPTGVDHDRLGKALGALYG